MATLRALKKKARELGHELTPELVAELTILADVPDEKIREEHRRIVVKEMAQRFSVPIAVMEQRIGKARP